MKKLIRDGKVAVLYSPEYGAGWYTWSSESNPECLFDSDIVELVLAGASAKAIEDAARAKWPDFYAGGVRNLTVAWVPVGTSFRVNEYDGYETIEIMGEVDWVVA